MNPATALLLPLLASGCLVVNPVFMLDEGTTSVAQTSVQDPLTTDAPPTSDGSGSATTGTTSMGGTVGGTTGDLTTGGATSMDTSTTGDPLDSGTDTSTSTSTSTDTDTDTGTSGGSPDGLPDCDPGDPALIACYDFEPDPNDPTRLVDGSQFDNDGVLSNVGVIAGVEGQAVEILEN
ncbi:MAG TPA: hypothetical protein VGB85_19990, partial [Nannocystis sp.]